jgi:hypothetical protein
MESGVPVRLKPRGLSGTLERVPVTRRKHGRPVGSSGARGTRTTHEQTDSIIRTPKTRHYAGKP